MVANHHITGTEPMLAEMRARRIEMTPYIANTLIHGWAADKNIAKAKEIYTLLLNLPWLHSKSIVRMGTITISHKTQL